jgi:hypothetical protein
MSGSLKGVQVSVRLTRQNQFVLFTAKTRRTRRVRMIKFSNFVIFAFVVKPSLQ